ncbi:hypothetical protein QOZ80_3AG0212530 [Eleusine coracana subsp. coracana]|nr:hypothetical protein QOZ80_3AG0212530 [Eleusine coracana subsp. coracana]
MRLAGRARYTKSLLAPGLAGKRKSRRMRSWWTATALASPGLAALQADGTVKLADHQGLLVLIVVFKRCHHGNRIYYLVYDSANASLAMLPCLPDNLEPTYTVTPVPMRRAATADDGKKLGCYELAGAHGAEVLARLRRPRSPLRVQQQQAAAAAARLLGVAYSDLPAGGSSSSSSSSSSDVVDEPVFVGLPPEYMIGFHDLPEKSLIEPKRMSRTMGYVGGAVKFVCIQRPSLTRLGNETVEVWMLDTERREWKQDEGSPFRWRELWKHVRFMEDETLRLGNVEPQYPVLMSDGGLCLLLDNRQMKRTDMMGPEYMCSFDMVSKRPRWYGLVTDGCSFNGVKTIR